MSELIRAVVAVSWPLLVTGRLAGRSLLPLAVLVIIAAVSGGVLGVLTPMDALHLPAWTGLGADMAALVLWALLGVLARAAGGVALPGPPILTAVAAGALIGEVGAAAMIAGMADRKAAARLALAAAGGAMIGRIGDPALVVLSESVGWQLAPLGLLCALVALPGEALPRLEGKGVVTGAAAVVALAALFSGAFLPHVLGAGCVLMAALAGSQLRTVALKPVVWCAGLVVLAMLSTAAGLAELAAWGLEQVQGMIGGLLLPALAAVGALMSILGDAPASALLSGAVLDRALDLSVEGVPAALAAGLAVGGLTPLVLAGAVREGLLRWGIQVLLAILWAAIVL